MSDDDLDTHTVRRLRDYLLDVLPDVEREPLELALLEDEDLYSTLLAVEEELLDECVRGELTENEASSFISYLDRLPEARERISLARAFQARPIAPRTDGARLDRAASEALETLRRLWALSSSTRFLVLAALLLLTLTSVFSAWRLYHLEATIERLQAELASSGAPNGRPLVDGHLSRPTSGTEQVAQTESTQQNPSFVLSAGLRRSVGAMPTLEIPTHAKAVTLRLDISADTYDRYRAALLDTDGTELISVSQLTAEMGPDRVEVPFQIPMESIASGDYSVSLEGRTDSEEYNVLNYYDFRVVLR